MPSPSLGHGRRLTTRVGMLVGIGLVAAPLAGPLGAQPGRVSQHNLVSNVPGLAAVLDPQLVNPWGISFGPTTPFWISDAGTGVSTLYNGAGAKQGLVVTIPGPGGPVPGVPTGQVFNSTGAFALGSGGNARFLFASATGTISGWNGGTTAQTMVNPGGGAAYTGLAIAGSGSSARLYAANFGNDRIDVWDGTFATVSGGFVDPNLPAGYSPFNVQTIGTSVYVMYAPKDPITGEEIEGVGNGIVDVYDTGGTLVRRLVTGGDLNDPWGITLAPAGFGGIGGFGGSLLVGNFGDGTIHAYDPMTGALRGELLDGHGNALVNEGLWALTFGNGGPGFDRNALYFTAGIDDEENGLFGRISAVPEPGSLTLVLTGLGALAVAARRRTRRSGPTD
ncbi:MAG: TIGR03118 family protein [Gemmatirosa sp.]|nr:TIGR03118 family protein [Gemmatirosa sp.]